MSVELSTTFMNVLIAIYESHQVVILTEDY
jgi:hypothetical protein